VRPLARGARARSHNCYPGYTVLGRTYAYITSAIRDISVLDMLGLALC